MLYGQSLAVLDFLLHAGSENVVIYFRDNIYIIKTLEEFQYVDEFGKDCGTNVRLKAKDIANLFTDETRLRQERRLRANLRGRLFGQLVQEDGANDEPLVLRRDESNSHRTKVAVGDDDLRRDIEESKQVADLAGFSAAPPLVQIFYSPLERLALSIEDFITSTGGTLAPDANETLTSWLKLECCLIQADIPTDPLDVLTVKARDSGYRTNS